MASSWPGWYVPVARPRLWLGSSAIVRDSGWPCSGDGAAVPARPAPSTQTSVAGSIRRTGRNHPSSNCWSTALTHHGSFRHAFSGFLPGTVSPSVGSGHCPLLLTTTTRRSRRVLRDPPGLYAACSNAFRARSAQAGLLQRPRSLREVFAAGDAVVHREVFRSLGLGVGRIRRLTNSLTNRVASRARGRKAIRAEAAWLERSGQVGGAGLEPATSCL